MTTPTPSTLHLGSERGVARITFNNPPVNVISATMIRELTEVLTALRDDASVRVIVFSSADPEFFLAHVDIRIGEEMDVLQQLAAGAPEGVNVFQSIGELIRHLPQVTIVELAGKARGGGAEVVAAADISFAALETAGIGQIESLMGIVPGGGGTQYLRQRVGRNRALEVVLTGELFDAETAAAYGWVNRAVPAAELHAFVERVARNVADLPDGVIAAAKAALPADDLAEGLLREDAAWSSQVSVPAVQQLMGDSLGLGAQTPEGERDLESTMRAVRP